jgi:hypothetical protein
MDDIAITVDPDVLRAMAGRAERSTEALRHVRIPGLDDVSLPGSAVGGIAGPALVAARLDSLAAELAGWAAAARASAAAFETAEQRNSGRLAGS